MSLEKLTKEKSKIHGQITELRIKAKKLQIKIDALSAEEAVKKKIEGMSDSEKAIAQKILAEGIESEEEVGVPGTI